MDKPPHHANHDRVSTEDQTGTEVSEGRPDHGRLVAVAILVATVVGAVGWFAVDTSRRLHDVETENAALRDQVSIVDDVDVRLETLQQELSDLETDLYDLGDAHYGEPTINDLDSRLEEAEDRIDSACHTLLFDFNAPFVC
jgi:uncharacterized protein YlxW (UPF0749 family)